MPIDSHRPVIHLTESFSYSEEALQIYRARGKISFEAELGAGEHDRVVALVVRLQTRIDEKFLARFPKLKYVVSPTTGLNHVDLEACRRRRIQVISLKGEAAFLKSITSTSELAFGLILALVKKIPASCSSVLKGVWKRDRFLSRQLSRMSLGIIGYGRLGRNMEAYGKAFGMRVRVYDKSYARGGRSRNAVDLRELLRESDVVSLHIDYSPENESFMNGARFKQMKSGCFFVNTARGELVDDAALLHALQSGRIAGAAVDVLRDEQSENLLKENVLIRYAKTHPGLIVTPHIGGTSLDARHMTEVFVAQKFARKFK